jgi:hypothetical protein
VTTIEMPDPPERELELEPKDDTFRSDADDPGARENLRRRLSLGGPVHRVLTASSTDDVETRRFLESEGADSDFYLVHLTCTLHPDEDEPFVEALIELDLSVADGAAPIAWSMQPDRMLDPVEISQTVSLGPKFKIFGVGIDLSAQRERTVTRQEPFVMALYELESTPSWALYRTAANALRGLHRFHLVVRAPRGSTVVGTALVEAKVQRKRFGVLPYSAALPGGPGPITFELNR